MSDVAELSLAEELGKAIDESVSVDQRTPTAESNSPSDASPPEAGDQQPESDSRARDAQGRFVRQEAQESGQPEVAPQAPEAPAEQPRQVDLPPSTWTPAAKAEYANLPEVIRGEIKKREADFQRGIDAYKQKAESGERILAEMRPYEAIIRSQGGTPESIIRNMLNTAYILNTGTPQQKAQLLLQAAQQYGADLSPYLQPQSQDGQFNPQQLTPIVNQLLAPVLQRVNQFESRFLTAEQQREQAVAEQTQSQIEAFKTATDDQGRAKHAYFDNVRGIMAALMEAGDAKSLEQAYEMACRAHPEVSQALSAEQRRAQEAKQLEEARKKAEDAKRAAAANVSGQGGVGIADTSKLGLRDELSARLEGRL